jgi:hypothetical protein
VKELLNLLNTEAPQTTATITSVKKAEKVAAPIVTKAKVKKPPRIVYESESSEEEIIVKKKPKTKEVEEPLFYDEEPEEKPKPVMYYKPKPAEPPKMPEKVAPTQNNFMQFKNRMQARPTIPSSSSANPQANTNSLVFL